MDSLEKNQELFDIKKSQLESEIEQSSEYNQYLNNVQNMRLLLNPSQNLQQGLRKMLKRKNQDCIGLLNLGVLLIDELKRVYRQRDYLEISRDELEKINEKMMKDQKEILQMNQTLENQSQELIKIINQQEKKLREIQQNELKLYIERSTMRKKLDQLTQIQKQADPEKLAQNHQQQLLIESITDIKSKFAELKQVSSNIRTKMLDESRKFEKKKNISNSQYLFSSTPVSIIGQKKFKESLKNIKLNRRAQEHKEDEDETFKFKPCQSIMQDETEGINEKSRNQLISLNLSECKDSNLLSDQMKCFKKVKEVKNISNYDFSQIKHQFSTLQSNLKQCSQLALTTSQSLIADISIIQKTQKKIEGQKTWNHIHSIISNPRQQKCMCKKVSHQLQSAHDVLFNYIVKDRIEPRRTIRKIKQTKRGRQKEE